MLRPLDGKSTTKKSVARLILRRLDDRIVAAGVETEQVEALLHVRRQRRGDVERLAACADAR